jgi:hypothetical protein
VIPLSSHLDDIDFDALLALARSRLPALAPEWTDYNYHDPGIMLVELLAWIADSQVYSLARNRQDERLAMARLLGISPHGAMPAKGTVYPLTPVTAAQLVNAGTRFTPTDASAPRLETTHDVTLLPIELTSISTKTGGFSVDHTAANARARATFAPFGEPPTPGAELHIELTPLDGGMPAAPGSILSIGFEIKGRSNDSTTKPDELGEIDVTDAASGLPLGIMLDSTDSMQRSGVMLFSTPASVAGGTTTLTIVLRPRVPTALMPRIISLAPNALPVAQRATFREQRFSATGRTGQILQIEPPRLFEPDEAAGSWVWRLIDDRHATTVRVSDGQQWRIWRRRERLGEAGPEDRVYVSEERSDGSRIQLRFGNGVNGRKPSVGETIEITSLQLSCGSSGNILSQLKWLLDSHRTRWVNRSPIRGGRDAQDADGALATVRETLRSTRLLATSEQIRSTVEALPDAFGIERAEIENGWERGRRSPSIPATRTLIVARKGATTDNPLWRRAIARRLQPRIAIGERLLVESPVYRRFGVKAEIVVAAGRLAEDVVRAIQHDIDERFGVITSARRKWPLGRNVEAIVIAGWIRRIDGVARVLTVTLLDETGRTVDSLKVKVGRGELPQLIAPIEIAPVSGSTRR